MKRQQIVNEIVNSKTSVGVGALGEILVTNALRYGQGVSCKRVGHTHSRIGDILVNGKTKIEVKTSRPDNRGQYKFCLRKNDKNGYTDYRVSDYVLLVCVSACGLIHTFLIETCKLAQRHITISNLTGKYNKFYKPLAKIGAIIQ